MRKNIIIMAIAVLTVTAAHAQLADGKKQVEKLCGCFDVDFKYAETFSPDPRYKFHDRDALYGRELVVIAEQSKNKIVLQHLLMIDDSTVIKHWREDWTYQEPILYTYNGDRTWIKHDQGTAAVKGKWTQSVWEVDDGPRYQGTSNWVTTDNKTFWESTVDAPLPRREYTVRNDYNIMRRDNRIVINDSGWVHEQDNDKILQADSTRKLLAQEKGINSYVHVPEQRCAAARAWWEKNKAFWQVVREQWQVVLNQHPTLAVKATAGDKKLYECLDVLWNDWSKGNIAANELAPKINAEINKFL